MLYEHWSEVKAWEWKNFLPAEVACPCCGELYLDRISMDRIQKARDLVGRPLIINSAHRCPIHNARVGGAPLSQHKLIAFDVSLIGYDRKYLFSVLKQAGFTSFGLYRTFIHADVRPGRLWYGKGAKELWSF